MIPVYTTYIHSSAKGLVSETPDSTYINEGKKVKLFEEQLVHKLDIINPVALNSWTTALHPEMVLADRLMHDEDSEKRKNQIVPPQYIMAIFSEFF